MADAVKSLPFQRLAMIYEGQGFVASIIRSINTAVMQLAGKGLPQKMFDSADSAIQWLTEESPDLAPHFHSLVMRADGET